MAVKSYHELIVWQKSMDLVEIIYRETSRFPTDERFGLTNQLRRAAVSIPSNIAEGQCRQTTADFLNFLAIARGSLGELETQVLIAARLKYLRSDARDSLLSAIGEVGRLLSGLRASLLRKRGPN
jgi:four helix bundle protein